MFGRDKALTFSDALTIRSIYPDASLKESIKLRNSGIMKDIIECKAMFPENTIDGTSAIVGSRSFVRWFINNKKAISVLLVATPVFALASFGLTSSFGLNLLTQPIVPSFPGSVNELMPAIPNTVACVATKAVSGNASFFSGNGVILLHIMIMGFFTLVVSSFLKFTGRGDMIPLVAFIGGMLILKEVIGLFNDVYGAIKTLINM